MRFDTRLVHGGQRPAPGTGALVPPVHVGVAYERGVQDPLRYFYARAEQPTREDLEECLAGLEDARFATVYSSGQAASATVLSLLGPGSRLVAGDDLYGGTHELFGLLDERGVEVRRRDLAADPDPGPCDLVWVETPSNPLLKIVDIERVARHAHERGALLAVDNTLASPALQQPLALGADVSVYSTTKFVAGHLDVLGGAVVCDDAALHERFTRYRTIVGNVPGGLDCFLVHRGLKTLSVRVERQVRSAGLVVAALEADPAVGRVHYPGRPEHRGHAVAARQMRAPGALVSFEYRGDPMRLLERVTLFGAAVSLGGVRSLIECPAAMTHRPVPRATRLRLGITDSLVRLSIGLEDPDDLVEDLRSALKGSS
ncbi:MAG TPA: PLP-dependent aspartate aminotransferase family protein [Dactylosporangium sp.]|jgi:cystathionine beta-lyase/cystathionine gamma-synthase|nr:PLP-dependent aspartate aminotransferase family protein [Dactylosporangium sp.]